MEINENLMKAIQKGDERKVRELINKGAHLNIQYKKWEYKTPLIKSIEVGNDAITNLLLNNGVDVNLLYPCSIDIGLGKYRTALHTAVLYEKYDIAKRIIDMGAQLDVVSYGTTALHSAISKNYTDIAILLINNGANYNIKGGNVVNRLTAYDLAKEMGNPDIIKAIEDKEKEKQIIKKEYINKLKNDTKLSDKAIEVYVNLKTWEDLDINELNDDEFDDLLMLYNRSEEVKEKSSKKEITKEQMKAALNLEEPICIRCNELYNIDFQNKTKFEQEIRELLKNEEDLELAKISGEKTGAYNKTFCMINYGKVVLGPESGYGVINKDTKNIHEVSITKNEIYWQKNGYRIREGEDSENMPIDWKIKNALKYLNKEGISNQIVMDVSDEDVDFIYWNNVEGREENSIKLNAVWLMREYQAKTGRTLPIYQYKKGKKDYLVETNFTKDEIYNMLYEELLDDSKKKLKPEYNSMEKIKFLMMFVDDIKNFPKGKKILEDFILDNEKLYVPKNVNDIMEGVNFIKLAGLIKGEEYKNRLVCDMFCNLNFDPIIINFLLNMKNKEENKCTDAVMEIISKIRSLATDKETLEKIKPVLKLVLENINIDLLFVAIYNKDSKLLSKILERGMNLDFRDGSPSPLVFAVKMKNKEVIKTLLNQMNDIDFVDGKGKVPIIEAIHTRDKEIAKMLLEKSAKVNIRDIYGRLPIMEAIHTGDKEIVKMLLEKSAKVNIRDTYGRLPIIEAIHTRDKEIVKMLLENGVDVNVKSGDGLKTALIEAIKLGDKDKIDILLKNGADIELENDVGQSPLIETIKTGIDFMLDALIGEGGGPDKVIEIMEMLLENGVDVNRKNGEGDLAVTRAIKLFGEKYENYGLPRPIRIRIKKIIKMLLKKNPDLNLQDKEGNLPLNLAIKEEDIELIKMLVDKGADVNKKDGLNVSPIDLARKSGRFKIKYFLIKNGAKCKPYEKIISQMLKINRTLKHKIYKIVRAPKELLVKAKKAITKKPIQKITKESATKENTPKFTK